MNTNQHVKLWLLVAGCSMMTPTLAQTPDGNTPALEEVCSYFMGQDSSIFGLCNAYCEAMDCDSPESLLKGSKSCSKVERNLIRSLDKFANIQVSSGDTVQLCQDIDGDGVPGLVDNCPSVANPAQLDSNDDGVGDACTEEPETCPQAIIDSCESAQSNAIEFGLTDQCSGFISNVVTTFDVVKSSDDFAFCSAQVVANCSIDGSFFEISAFSSQGADPGLLDDSTIELCESELNSD